MQRTTNRPGHAYCSACRQTFPSSWFQNHGAVRKDGRDFCSKKCADDYDPETQTLAGMFFDGPALTIGRR